MDHYLFTARSITHAQRMAQILEREGIHTSLRRVGSRVTSNGCGYSLEIPERKFQKAEEALRTEGVIPVKVYHITDGTPREVTM